ncbi:hypothetical protein PM082_022517 [Marasmius tenuissimus]|nr:hypothetical protein PM082_022517 [Marasmius tenuissimus]
MAPFSFIASAILSLVNAFTLLTNDDDLAHDKVVLGPDHDGHCHLGSKNAEVPCPPRPALPLAIACIVGAILCTLVATIALLVWYRRVPQLRTEDPLSFSPIMHSMNSAEEISPPQARSTSNLFTMVADIECGVRYNDKEGAEMNLQRSSRKSFKRHSYYTGWMTSFYHGIDSLDD